MHASTGDVVTVLFRSERRAAQNGPHTVRVTQVAREYGRVNDGKNYRSPCIHGINTVTGEEMTFAASFIIGIVSRSNAVQLPINIYRDEPHDWNGLVERDGSLWTSGLGVLAMYALSQLPYEIERAIHDKRLKKLYGKSLQGCKRIQRTPSGTPFFYTVDGKKFTAWVRKNWSRILMTVEEMEEVQTEFEQDVERSYRADLDALLDQDDERREEARLEAAEDHRLDQVREAEQAYREESATRVWARSDVFEDPDPRGLLGLPS